MRFDGKKLRKERLKNKWSYGFLAEKMRGDIPTISRQNIAAWEKGTEPKHFPLIALAKAFNVDEKFFFVE